MFLCILGEIASYLFKGPRKLIDGSIPTIFPHKKQKEEREKRLQNSCFSIIFAEFLITPFYMTSRLNKCLNDWMFEWFVYELFLATRRNGLVVTFFYSRPKVEMRQN